MLNKNIQLIQLLVVKIEILFVKRLHKLKKICYNKNCDLEKNVKIVLNTSLHQRQSEINIKNLGAILVQSFQ